MATTTICIPVVNGRVHSTATPEIGTVIDAAGSRKWTAKFDADAAEERMSFAFPVFGNALNASESPEFRILWRAAAASGNVIWLARSRAFYEGLDTASSAALTFVNAATSGAGLVNSATVSVGGANRDSLMVVAVGRGGSDPTDTMTGDAELLELAVSYPADPLTGKGYLWLPANAAVIPTGSIATLSSRQTDNAGVQTPFCINLTDAANNYLDHHFSLPSNFSGNLKISPWFFAISGSGEAVAVNQAAAKIAVGGSVDPALTSGTAFASNAGVSSVPFRKPTPIAAPGTFAAGDEVRVRITRNNADAATCALDYMGLLVEYDISPASPQTVRLDPGSGVGTATFTLNHGTNSSWPVARFADASDLFGDYLLRVPANYGSGGTLRIRWTSAAASGNAYLRVDQASPASGASADPALVSGTAFAAATTGANVVNETTVAVSSSLAASDLLYLRVNRLASDVLDTLGSSVDILSLVFEATPA